jgi:hypothetical protein
MRPNAAGGEAAKTWLKSQIEGGNFRFQAGRSQRCPDGQDGEI